MATLVSDNILFHCILPRLPVKSLIRFKCVSRSWCSAIEDDDHHHYFWKLHRKHSSSSRKPKVAIYDMESNIHIYDMINIADHERVTTTFADVNGLPQGYDIVSSCDSLLCLENVCPKLILTIAGKPAAYCLFDVHSRSIRPIHTIEDIYRPSQLTQVVREPASGKYKMLVWGGHTIFDMQYPEQNCKLKGWILTLEANAEDDQWRSVSTVGCEWMHATQMHCVYKHPPRVFGAAFWICDNYFIKDFHDSCFGVVAFDIAKENFRKIAVPLESRSSRNLDLAGSETQGLNLFDFNTRQFRLEVWVLKDYDSENPAAVTWTKRFNIDFEFLPKIILHLNYSATTEVAGMFGEQVFFKAERAKSGTYTRHLEFYSVRLNESCHYKSKLAVRSISTWKHATIAFYTENLMDPWEFRDVGSSSSSSFSSTSYSWHRYKTFPLTTLTQFAEDFDFVAMKEKFKEYEIWGDSVGSSSSSSQLQLQRREDIYLR